MNSVEQMIRDANPIQGEPELLSNDELDALLLLARTRSGIVDVQEVTTPVEPDRKQPRGWLVAAAAFAVVIVLVGAVMLFSSPTDDTPPATTPPTTVATPATTVAAIEQTPTTLVEAAVEETPTTTTTEAAPTVPVERLATIAAYEATWNDGDEETFRTLFAPGAEREADNFEMSGDVDLIIKHMRGRRAMGLDLSIDGCTPLDDKSLCTASFSGLVPMAMSYAPWRDRYIFSFDGDQISHIETVCIICWEQAAEWRFMDWIKTVEPSAQLVLSDGYMLADSEEKGAAWLEWAPKWHEAGRP